MSTARATRWSWHSALSVIENITLLMEIAGRKADQAWLEQVIADLGLVAFETVTAQQYFLKPGRYNNISVLVVMRTHELGLLRAVGGVVGLGVGVLPFSPDVAKAVAGVPGVGLVSPVRRTFTRISSATGVSVNSAQVPPAAARASTAPQGPACRLA